MFTSEGTYSSTLDNKGRFQLPTVILRDVNDKNEGRFMVNRSTIKCFNTLIL
jgi:DNA-binding transcriptional regulator/RsmH inhibitor MraZ